MIGINNPFNIRYDSRNRWIGLDGQTRGFCNFNSLEFGVRAACVLVMRSYRKKNIVSVSDIVMRFAPSSENDTDVYINYICSSNGWFPFRIVVKKADYVRLLRSMSCFEGNCVSSSFIEYVIKKYKL